MHVHSDHIFKKLEHIQLYPKILHEKLDEFSVAKLGGLVETCMPYQVGCLHCHTFTDKPLRRGNVALCVLCMYVHI